MAARKPSKRKVMVNPAGSTRNKGGKGSSGRTTTTQGIYRPTGGVEIESYRYERRKPTSGAEGPKKSMPRAKKKGR